MNFHEGEAREKHELKILDGVFIVKMTLEVITKSIDVVVSNEPDVTLVGFVGLFLIIQVPKKALLDEKSSWSKSHPKIDFPVEK